MLLWLDGMDRYGATADLTLRWSVTNFSGGADFLSTSGLNGGGAMQLDGDQIVRRLLTSTLSSGGGFHAAFWVKFVSIADLKTFFHMGTNVQNGTNNRLMAYIGTRSTGAIYVNSHGVDFATPLTASPAGTVTTGTWYFIEYSAKWNTSGSGGFIKVWINGNIIIDFSGTTNSGTVPSTVTQVGPVIWAGGHTINYDDFIFWDESGSDFALTQLSTSYVPEIETLSVDANDSVQFTPSTGSNFQNVDDTAFHDSDTTYNSSATTGHVDKFTLTDQSGTPSYTFAVGVHAVAKIDAAGVTTFRVQLDSGGTVGESPDNTLTTSYVDYFMAFGLDPNTTAVWGTSAINSVKPAYKNQSVA